ncbi:MAG: ABC transporter permease [Janthinobacterium lividum]
MQVLSFIGWRLVQLVPTILLVAVLIFGLMRLLPGDPALTLLGNHATPETLAALRHQMGLDRSIGWQFWSFIGNLARGEFGTSVTMSAPVWQLIVDRTPITLMLTTMAAVIAIVIAVPAAFAGALRPNGWMDAAIQSAAQIGLSMPVFYIGLLLLITVAAGLGWFPVGGIGRTWFQDLYFLFLPALTMGVSLAAILMRNLRASLSDVLSADYVSFARAKGLRPKVVLGRHVLRNALVSTLTLFGLQTATLVGNAVITETVFGIPGIGRLMIDSIFSRDYAVVQAMTIVIAVLVALIFLMVDTAQMLLDPRSAR